MSSELKVPSHTLSKLVWRRPSREVTKPSVSRRQIGAGSVVATKDRRQLVLNAPLKMRAVTWQIAFTM